VGVGFEAVSFDETAVLATCVMAGVFAAQATKTNKAIIRKIWRGILEVSNL
jgi:hypothetical protein